MMGSKSPGFPEHFNLIYLDTVDSTNSEAVRRLSKRDPTVATDTIIHAPVQTAGRGRRGRPWTSHTGNLYCSIIVRPEVALSDAANIGYVTALAIQDMILTIDPEITSVQMKWPNDVLINGQKVSGILLESASRNSTELDWLVVGVGINVSEFPKNTPFPATSLHQEGIKTPELDILLGQFARSFGIWYGTWQERGFAAIRDHWLDRARGIGEEITVRLENTELSGIFSGIDHNGALLLRQQDKVQTISAGDVFFPEPN